MARALKEPHGGSTRGDGVLVEIGNSDALEPDQVGKVPGPQRRVKVIDDVAQE
jgi:hypothetical protein